MSITAQRPLVTSAPPPSLESITAKGRYVILLAAFLGWMFSGFQMAVTTLASRAATTDFLRSGQVSAEKPLDLRRLLVAPQFGRSAWTVGQASSLAQDKRGRLPYEAPADESAALAAIAAKWFSWYNAAFLFGAAAGGLLFGWLGDRIGRVRAMAASILTFSLFSGLGYFSRAPEQLLLLRFLSGSGVGGMWPTGVALASEAWSESSRPLVAGLLGTAANVGLVIFNVIGYFSPVVPESWRWTLLVCAAPAVLAVYVWFGVPESRRWLAVRDAAEAAGNKRISLLTVFRPPLTGRTLIGIAIGTIPLLGGWGATQWIIPWADTVSGAARPEAKALAAIMRSGGAAVGSLFGGWLASLCGRRLTYFLISLASLVLGEYIYLGLTPKDGSFWAYVFALGLVSTIFFGWLPLYLPELFPTRARAAGAGVSFNFGRILTAVGVLAAGWITFLMHDDYGRAGSVTTLVYALGMLVILVAPDTTKHKLRDE